MNWGEDSARVAGFAEWVKYIQILTKIHWTTRLWIPVALLVLAPQLLITILFSVLSLQFKVGTVPFLSVLDMHHVFSVFHKIIRPRLCLVWFYYGSGEQVPSSKIQPCCCTSPTRWVREHSGIPSVISLYDEFVEGLPRWHSTWEYFCLRNWGLQKNTLNSAHVICCLF